MWINREQYINVWKQIALEVKPTLHITLAHSINPLLSKPMYDLEWGSLAKIYFQELGNKQISDFG